MRRFKDGDTITIEPWRAKAFPVVKDLVVDRSAFDRIIAAGGYVSVNCGGAPDGNAIPIPKDVAEAAMDSAACIGCGACVAACKNASAHLFMSAKISHLALLPQGQLERYRRVVAMIEQADAEGFGSCSNEGECEAVCPKEIPISNIARMTREYIKAQLLTVGGCLGRPAGCPPTRLGSKAVPDNPTDGRVEPEVGHELQLAAGCRVGLAQSARRRAANSSSDSTVSCDVNVGVDTIAARPAPRAPARTTSMRSASNDSAQAKPARRHLAAQRPDRRDSGRDRSRASPRSSRRPTTCRARCADPCRSSAARRPA